MELVLGIDQGGTKTSAAIADLEGNILGQGRVEGALHSVTGLDYAIQQTALAAQSAAKAAGVPCGPFAAVAAGMSGADFSYEYELLRKALADRFDCEKVRVVNDCIVALRAGTWEEDAAVICAGTGLNCAVCTGDGRQFVYGYYIDDRWQGGGSIARQAIMTVFESHVGLRGATALTGEVLRYFGADSVDTLLQRKVRGELDTDGVSRLAEAVDRCAAVGDAESARILDEFGCACAWYAVTGLHRFNLLAKPVTVVLSGSIFKSKGIPPREAVVREIHKRAPLARVTDARYEPVVGGVILALEEAGVTCLNRDKIEESAVRCDMIRKLSQCEGKAERAVQNGEREDA